MLLTVVVSITASLTALIPEFMALKLSWKKLRAVVVISSVVVVGGGNVVVVVVVVVDVLVVVVLANVDATVAIFAVVL